jgi:hypothetical protein
MRVKEISNFSNLEVVITLKYFLKRRNFKFKIEADDNLQDVIAATTIGTVLQLRTTKNSYTFKKLIVRITYADPIKEHNNQ